MAAARNISRVESGTWRVGHSIRLESNSLDDRGGGEGNLDRCVEIRFIRAWNRRNDRESYTPRKRGGGRGSLQTIAYESVCLTRNRSSTTNARKRKKEMAETAEIIGGRGGEEGAAKPTIIEGHGIDSNDRFAYRTSAKSYPFFLFFFLPHRIPLITDIFPLPDNHRGLIERGCWKNWRGGMDCRR